MTFDPNWPHGHVTRDGRKARIICTDANNRSWPVVALVQRPGTIETAKMFSAAGESYEDNHDLLNAPAPKRKVKVDAWCNVHSCNWLVFYEHKAGADACTPRIGLIHLIGSIEEGAELTVDLSTLQSGDS